MPVFFALVDAVTGREHEVGVALGGVSGLSGFVPCRERNHDFLVKFDASSFDVVDDFLQTHVRQLPGVKGVEIILDWDDYSSNTREAHAKLS